MVTIKSKKEIEFMREACKVVALTYKELEERIKPGMTTWELDQIAEKTMRSLGAIPAEKGYDIGIRGVPKFPASICVSINDEVVHGIPGERRIVDGDVVSIDIGVEIHGYHSDAARTYVVGHASKEVQDLVKNTELALIAGLQKIHEGAKIGDIGAAIEDFAHQHGLSVVEELVGHGVGTNIHEDPDVPNYGRAGVGVTLRAGMVLAVEPMLNLGERYVYLHDDDWTISTEDGLPSAHFEHTVVVTKDGYKILTGEN